MKSILLTAMIYLLPASMQLRSYFREPIDEATQRYDSIAEDIEAVVKDPTEAPLFEGPAARDATGLLLATIAWHESGYRKDVDSCHGAQSKGDHGRSIGLMQIMRGPNYEGHSAEEICGDRRLAIRLGLHVLRRAKTTCSRTSPRVWVQSFESGLCDADTTASRSICAAFERVGARAMPGVSCNSIFSGEQPVAEGDPKRTASVRP